MPSMGGPGGGMPFMGGPGGGNFSSNSQIPSDQMGTFKDQNGKGKNKFDVNDDSNVAPSEGGADEDTVKSSIENLKNQIENFKSKGKT